MNTDAKILNKILENRIQQYTESILITITKWHIFLGCKDGSTYAAAAAKLLQSCPTLCDPTDSSPPRLPRPWDSLGKNTGVGCHFLLQCVKVKSESELSQPCLTPSDPMDCSLRGSSVHGIFQARVLEWVAIAFSSFNIYGLNNILHIDRMKGK